MPRKDPISSAKLAANQANAQLSTGPKSQRGKERARYNALKEGFHARQVVLSIENPDDLAKLHTQFFDKYQPVDEIERDLADQAVDCLWRSRRVTNFEKHHCKELRALVELRYRIEITKDSDRYMDTWSDNASAIYLEAIDNPDALERMIGNYEEIGEALDNTGKLDLEQLSSLAMLIGHTPKFTLSNPATRPIARWYLALQGEDILKMSEEQLTSLIKQRDMLLPKLP